MDLYDLASKHSVKYVLFSFSTLNSDCRSCVLPTHALKDAETSKEIAFSPASLFPTYGIESNFTLVPDISTFIQLHWKKEFAWVQCNINFNGNPYNQCPRTALQRMVEKAKMKGFCVKCGLEPEFTLLKKDGLSLYDPVDCKQSIPHLDTKSYMQVAPLLGSIHDVMHLLGWKPYKISHEVCPCQYEINFEYTDVLQMADRICFLKFMIKELAEKEDMLATFMPLPFDHWPLGNGLHVNISLWSADGDTNLFPNGEDHVLGLSKTAYSFIAGLMDHAEESCAILCPTVNSYKRLYSNKLSPPYLTWGGNIKSTWIRVPTADRLEHRLPDGSMNPHLGLAVIMAAGIDGVDRNLDPPSKMEIDQLDNYFFSDKRMKSKTTELTNCNTKDVAKYIPSSLLEALNKLESSQFMRECLGDELVEGFVFMKKKEWFLYVEHVSQWEKDYYLCC